MFDRHPYCKIRDDDTERLRRDFGDNRIYFCEDVRTHELQAWYKPNSGREYRICTADNVAHASQLLRARMRFDKTRAQDLIREIDAHNEKVLSDKDEDALHEVRHDLRNIVNGRQMFMPPARRRQHASV